jgi:septal ring factor EnvC (AmiA/AmiB activator)
LQTLTRTYGWGSDSALDPLYFLLQAVSLKRKQVQLSRVLEASQNSCSIQAARVPDLQQQANQLTAQLEAVQEANSTCTQQRVQLQQQLGETQEQLCSTQQQVVQLQDSMEVLQAQVSHNCSDQLHAETGQGCSIALISMSSTYQ